MRRVGRLLLGALAVIAVLGGSVLAAQALLGTDSAPKTDERTGEPAPVPAERARTQTTQPRARQQGPLFDESARLSWKELERSLPARAGLAVVPLGEGSVSDFGSFQAGHAWSTIKVPILVTRMRERGGALSPTEESWASSALTASDNEAAAALFEEIEDARGGLSPASQAVEGTLRLAGDTGTAIATAPPPSGAISTYGQTEWSLPASALFFRALAHDCLLDAAATNYVLDLMEDVVTEQRWGLGEAGFDPDWLVAFKGGWGPEGSSSGPYLVRQSGIVRDGKAGIAVAIATQADTGSFEGGIEALDRVAAWLRDNLRSLGTPASLSC